ncbi:MAG: hypothetical protein JSV09_08080 [Thermoplasmata archaeon]|nr:MAG: hypothetical protein JSV09_08080 [Thermoplasmata archaeon]
MAVVKDGKKLEMATIPVSLFASKAKIVETLLREAKRSISKSVSFF